MPREQAIFLYVALIRSTTGAEREVAMPSSVDNCPETMECMRRLELAPHEVIYGRPLRHLQSGGWVDIGYWG